MGARRFERQASLVEQRDDLTQRSGEVIRGFLRRLANAGDDFDTRLEQLILGLGVFSARVFRASLSQNLRRDGHKFARLTVDDAVFDLNAHGRFGRAVEFHVRTLSPLRLGGIPNALHRGM